MISSSAIVDIDKTDTRFLRKLAAAFGASNLSKCFQCGVCVSSCPIRGVEATFNPRKIMKMARLGLKKEVYYNAFIWLCSMCFLCQERCPQDVRPSDVMTVLRNMAAEEGVAPASLQKLIVLLGETGRIYPLDDFTEDERTDRGLPEIVLEPDFVKKLLEA